ncbi:MAG: endonuclease III [bacterium]
MTARIPASTVKKKSSPKELSARADEILVRLKKLNPNPHCELYYETPYQLLLSVVLSAQATDKSVNAAVTDLYKNGLTVDDVIALGEKGFLEKIRRIGLAPTKAKNSVKLSQIIKDKFNGEIPTTREDLESLPGVGRKTASVILGEIFREPTLAVDTHVFRVTRRLGLHKSPTPEKAEQKLLSVINPKWLPMAHHWFILHGRYTCLARGPKCGICTLNDFCTSKDKVTSQTPAKSKRAK